jgi:hypothetical protein
MGQGVYVDFPDIAKLPVYRPGIDALRYLFVLLGRVVSMGIETVFVVIAEISKITIGIKRLCKHALTA